MKVRFKKRFRPVVWVFLFSIVFASFPARAGAAPDDNPTVAYVGGKAIARTDLEAAARLDTERIEIQHLQAEAAYVRNKHLALERALGGIIENKVLEAEAGARGISKEVLLAHELEGKVKEPTEADLSAHFPIDRQPGADTRAKIFAQMRQALKKENYNKAKAEYVAQLKKKYRVSEMLPPLRLKVSAAGSPGKGPETAPVTVVLFSDFQCVACRSFEPALQDVLKKYGSQVRFVYRSYTFGNPVAMEAAQAALCAGDQKRFWDMHDQILRSGRPDMEFLNMNAAAIRLNMDEFGACLGSGRYADAVRRDTYDAAALGVTSTPALFVNGRPLLAPRSVNEVAQLIDDELLHLAHPAAKSPRAQARPAFPHPEASK